MRAFQTLVLRKVLRRPTGAYGHAQPFVDLSNLQYEGDGFTVLVPPEARALVDACKEFTTARGVVRQEQATLLASALVTERYMGLVIDIDNTQDVLRMLPGLCAQICMGVFGLGLPSEPLEAQSLLSSIKTYLALITGYPAR